MQSRLWGVMTVTPMNNASLPPAPLPNPPLISGRPIARRVPGPSQPSFPHGKYLTLTVAHVCHITCRFRREKKHCMYDEWWSYIIGSWWKEVLFFCGALTVWNTYICTHLAIILLQTPALPPGIEHTSTPSHHQHHHPTLSQGCVNMDHI